MDVSGNAPTSILDWLEEQAIGELGSFLALWGSFLINKGRNQMNSGYSLMLQARFLEFCQGYGLLGQFIGAITTATGKEVQATGGRAVIGGLQTFLFGVSMIITGKMVDALGKDALEYYL